MGLALHHQCLTFINAYCQATTNLPDRDWGLYIDNDLLQPRRSALSGRVFRLVSWCLQQNFALSSNTFMREFEVHSRVSLILLCNWHKYLMPSHSLHTRQPCLVWHVITWKDTIIWCYWRRNGHKYTWCCKCDVSCGHGKFDVAEP